MCELDDREAWRCMVELESVLRHSCWNNGQTDEDCLQFVRQKLFVILRAELRCLETHPLCQPVK